MSSPSNSSFKPGSRVFGGGLGAYAEEIWVPEEAIRHVPEQWTNAAACAVGASGAVSYGALLDVCQVKTGETVLVLGASGGLGVMAVQIAKAVGARVIAVVGDEEKAAMVRDIGADAVVYYHNKNWEDLVKKLTKDGEGVDVVYDGIGAVESGVKCLRYRGRLVIVGFAARNGDMENIRANRILLKSIAVHGYVSQSHITIVCCLAILLTAYRGSVKMADGTPKGQEMSGVDSCAWWKLEAYDRSSTRQSIVDWKRSARRWRT